MKKLFLLIVVLFIVGCSSEAEIASRNLSTAADMFEINRRVVFYNVITGDYVLSVEGRCSIEKDNTDNQLELTCKIDPTTYKKHYLGLADNVTYFVEQLDAADVDVYHYRVIFKPDSISPNIQIDSVE